MPGRACLVTERFGRAAKPIIGFGLAQRSVGDLAHELEVDVGRDRIIQLAQRQPAGEVSLLLGRIDGQRPGILHQVVGDARLTYFQRLIGVGAALDPPVVRRCHDIGIVWHGRQQLPGFFIAIRAPQYLDAMIDQTPVRRLARDGRG